MTAPLVLAIRVGAPARVELQEVPELAVASRLWIEHRHPVAEHPRNVEVARCTSWRQTRAGLVPSNHLVV